MGAKPSVFLDADDGSARESKSIKSIDQMYLSIISTVNCIQNFNLTLFLYTLLIEAADGLSPRCQAISRINMAAVQLVTRLSGARPSKAQINMHMSIWLSCSLPTLYILKLLMACQHDVKPSAASTYHQCSWWPG